MCTAQQWGRGPIAVQCTFLRDVHLIFLCVNGRTVYTSAKASVDEKELSFIKSGVFCILLSHTPKIFVRMGKEDTVRVDGTVEELLPNMTFVVLLQNGVRVTAYLCGKMRMKNIRVLVGDTVTVEMSPYDLTKARIVYRQK